jgi:hypothetical protein
MTRLRGLRGPNRPPFLPSAFCCGFRAFLILPCHYPTDLTRRFRPFVDLLLTRGLERKKPPLRAALKLLIYLGNFGCGGRI